MSPVCSLLSRCIIVSTFSEKHPVDNMETREQEKTMTIDAVDPQGATTHPMTGKEYLESLRDGREIWIYGERVKDVTTHPAFRNTARMIARLYDALHDPALQDVLTTETDTGSGSRTHKYFKAPKSGEEQLAARDAIAAWSRLTYGWLGRSPDYKASFLGTLGANAEFYRPFEANARAWYKKAQERVMYLNHAIIHLLIVIAESTNEPRCASTSRKRQTPACTSAVPRLSPPVR